MKTKFVQTELLNVANVERSFSTFLFLHAKNLLALVDLGVGETETVCKRDGWGLLTHALCCCLFLMCQGSRHNFCCFISFARKANRKYIKARRRL